MPINLNAQPGIGRRRLRPRRRGAGRVDAAEGPRHVLGDARELGEAVVVVAVVRGVARRGGVVGRLRRRAAPRRLPVFQRRRRAPI